MNASLNAGALLLGLGLALPAQALDYRFSFAGVVDQVSGSVGYGIGTGTPVSGSVIYNADAPPDEIQGGSAYYYNAISAFEIEIGDFEASGPPFSFTFFDVGQGTGIAHISLGLTAPFSTFLVTLYSDVGSVAAPLPKSLSPFSASFAPNGSFIFEINDPSNPNPFVTIDWTSHTVAAVPEPETWAFLLGGLAVVAWRLRSRA